MNKAFVDTSAFVALRNKSEKEHRAARRALSKLLDDGIELFTSNYVFAETYTALLVRVSRHEAIIWGRSLKSSRLLEIVRADELMEDDAWRILESHEDKNWSYVDATSFAIMARESLTDAFSFDGNFAQRGLRMIPG